MTKKIYSDLEGIGQNAGESMLSWVGKKPLSAIEYFPAQEKEVHGSTNAQEFNKLFWGDNLQVLSHLLKEYRGKVDLIYIDPPFDSKADYVKKIKVRGEKIPGKQQSIIEEKQYTDIWENGEYLQFMYERLQILRELLSETGSIYLHCDWHKNSYLRILMDEIFGAKNLINEIIWCYTGVTKSPRSFRKKHDTIYLYSKSEKFNFNIQHIPYKKLNATNKVSHSSNKVSTPEEMKLLLKRGKELEDWWTDINYIDGIDKNGNGTPTQKIEALLENALEKILEEGQMVKDWWTDVYTVDRVRNEISDYPTQKPEALLERIIKASSNPGDLILDCFVGSGTTCVVAQRLNRKWIGCDINTGSIQTTSNRIQKVIDDQTKGQSELTQEDKILDTFKVFNVNEYDIFKNELEAKEIIIDLFGVEPLKQSFFDGKLDDNFVKILPLNRILNQLDIKSIINEILANKDMFTPKISSSQSEALYEEGVLIVASGVEFDVLDFAKTENDTGVKITIKDIQTDNSNLIFKQNLEAILELKSNANDSTIEIKDFFSPLLMKKLKLQNSRESDEKKTNVLDFKQIIDSVAIDSNYNGKIFNPDIIDIPSKNETIQSIYKVNFEEQDAVLAIKIIDVLGEEYFETIQSKESK